MESEAFSELIRFFRENRKAALGFSGGVDSSFLLYAGRKAGAEIRAYYVRSIFQPEFEFRDAERMAKELGAEMKVLTADILSVPEVAENPADRCYYCKTAIFSKIAQAASEDGYGLLIDGTNASDDAADRPGMRALRELSVRSPLRECGLSKTEIRQLSKEAGLFTWDKPAYACLATRVPAGTALNRGILEKIDGAEETLRGMGYRDLRVRFFHGAARLQLAPDDMRKAGESLGEIREALEPYFTEVLLDLNEINGRR